MYIFAGPTNVGKSIFLSNIASNAAAEDKNVLVIATKFGTAANLVKKVKAIINKAIF